MPICLREHKDILLRKNDGVAGRKEGEELLEEAAFEKLREEIKPFRAGTNCYSLTAQNDAFILHADYCIGIDRIGETGEIIYVEPKVNAVHFARFAAAASSEEDDEPFSKDTLEDPQEVDFLGMLLMVMEQPEAAQHVDGLVKIDWDADAIEISFRQDHLTPILVVQFLQLVRRIVRKGLRKGYYKVTENLTARVKGKILIGQHLRQNVFKNRFTQTLCAYEVFGIDTPENRFLKKVLRFAGSYVENNGALLGKENQKALQHLVYYARPAFEAVGEAPETAHELRQVKPNPFFREYGEAMKIGGYLLRRFGHNISHAASRKTVSVPPFWIDMPRLFELYVYSQMLAQNPEAKRAIQYHLTTYGNELDILVSHENTSVVIDAKYKLAYESGRVIHSDIRQVAGYARLHKVLDELKHSNRAFDRERVVPCLIIHPITEGDEEPSLMRLENLLKAELSAYQKVYRLGVKLPVQRRET